MGHHLELRVYYEDTDFSGRVYHASYLRFLERGRTEWLRRLGYQHSALSAETGTVFAVSSLQIEFLKPALMDDVLRIVTRMDGTEGARIVFRQEVQRGAERLASASVKVVALRGDRPVRPPRELMESLRERGDS